MTKMHDYAKHGEPTSCCNRKAADLPLGEGRTTDQRRITCDGTFTPAVMAHELYPHPSEYADEPPKLGDAVRYHLARTIAMYPPETLSDDRGFDREWMDRLHLMLCERTTACLVVALHLGLSGQEALDWAHAYSSGDDGELIYDLAKTHGVELDRIRPYPMREQTADEVNP